MRESQPFQALERGGNADAARPFQQQLPGGLFEGFSGHQNMTGGDLGRGGGKAERGFNGGQTGDRLSHAAQTEQARQQVQRGGQFASRQRGGQSNRSGGTAA
jgi:hypothetical protein